MEEYARRQYCSFDYRNRRKKMASYLYRTAQPLILAAFLPWGGSIGAGRIRLAGCKGMPFDFKYKILFCHKIVSFDHIHLARRTISLNLILIT